VHPKSICSSAATLQHSTREKGFTKARKSKPTKVVFDFQNELILPPNALSIEDEEVKSENKNVFNELSCKYFSFYLKLLELFLF
jgi:hypothetical protein